MTECCFNLEIFERSEHLFVTNNLKKKKSLKSKKKEFYETELYAGLTVI